MKKPTIADRAFDIAAATFPRAPRDGLAHPFGFDQHPPYRWRVSPDVRVALLVYGGLAKDTPITPGDRLLGEPLTVDESLPPNSMLLEPIDSNGSSI